MRCLFPHVCRVYTFRSVFDEQSGKTESVKTELYSAFPCRVSFRRYPAGEEKHGGVIQKQGILLFTPPKAELPSGAWVEYGGRVYRHKGIDAVYPTHRECDLLLEEMA